MYRGDGGVIEGEGGIKFSYLQGIPQILFFLKYTIEPF